jgi:hypothetical protein
MAKVIGEFTSKKTGAIVKVTPREGEADEAAVSRTVEEHGNVPSDVKTAMPQKPKEEPRTEASKDPAVFEPVGPILNRFLERVGEKRAAPKRDLPKPLTPDELRKGFR